MRVIGVLTRTPAKNLSPRRPPHTSRSSTIPVQFRGDYGPTLVGVRRNAVMAVRRDPVVRLARLLHGIDVNCGTREKLEVMTKLVLDLLGHLVPLFHRQIRRD